ncbi:MAG: metallophosphoesterase [Euryarchaeota archaeon]
MDKIRVLQLSLFISFFFIAYLTLNYFILSTLNSIFSLVNNYILYSLIGIFSISFPLSMIIGQRHAHIVIRTLYTFSVTWLGIALFFLWGFILLGIIQLWIQIPLKLSVLLLTSLVLIITIYSGVNAYYFHQKNIKIPLKNLKNPVRVLQLSDIHVGSVRNTGYLKRLITKIEEIKPELVLITGDLADGSSPIHQESFKPFKSLKMPIYFVSGNHDTYVEWSKVKEALNFAEIKVINHDFVVFKGLQIVGIGYCMQRKMLGPLLSQLEFDRDIPSILMHHLPSEWESARENGISLQISGHTHHGQFYPINLLVRFIFPYFKGLYKNGESYLYVSAGTGTWGPPLRWGSRNEVTVIDLIPD